MFKRGIIARDDLVHTLYIIPYDDFQKVHRKYISPLVQGVNLPIYNTVTLYFIQTVIVHFMFL